MKSFKKLNLKNFFKKDIFKYIFYIIILPLPFLLLDLLTRKFGIDAGKGFYKLFNYKPLLFSILWTSFFISLSLCFNKKIGKIIYSIFFFLFFILFLVNNIYFSTMDKYFDFSLLGLAGEGSAYLIDSIKNTNINVYIYALIIFVLYLTVMYKFPNKKQNNYKLKPIPIISLIVLHLLLPNIYGKANVELTWNSWRNARNIYNNFNDNNKSMSITGLYEYSLRNFYVTYIRERKTNDEKELEFLSNVFTDEAINKNSYTGLLKDKNLIILQLEGIDNWLVTKETMPNLYSLMNKSINFTNHYSYYNGGGSTFNSEFAVNTGYLTPVSYTQNAYTFNKNSFPVSLARLFKERNYSVNAFHMNSSEYYSRGINYSNWGYDKYYGLKDLNQYKDNSYELDRNLILNETFYNLMFPKDTSFVDYIITYSVHTPFDKSKAVCKMLAEEQEITKILTEEDCIRLQAKETDNFIGLLIKALKDNNLYDNTAIVAFADHYLYTVTDNKILENNGKDIKTNLINKTPFFIWSSNIKKETVKKVTSQLNILPTILNLYGFDYKPSHYVMENALDKNYKGVAFFSDYSWYDGKYYVSDGFVQNKVKITDELLEEKNSYVDYLIKKNDLVLKYNYFKTLK